MTPEIEEKISEEALENSSAKNETQSKSSTSASSKSDKLEMLPKKKSWITFLKKKNG